MYRANRLECICFRCHMTKLEPDDYLKAGVHMFSCGLSSVHFKSDPSMLS